VASLVIRLLDATPYILHASALPECGGGSQSL
jgi:hypothetical protein